MDLNVAFGKGSNARSALDDVVAAAGQEVTPIQGSPPHHHDVVHRIRQDMAKERPQQEPKEASSDLERPDTGNRPPAARIHRRPVVHTAGQRRPTAPRDAARRQGAPPAQPGAAAPNPSPLPSNRAAKNPAAALISGRAGSPATASSNGKEGRPRRGAGGGRGREPSRRPREGDARGGRDE